MRSCCLYNILRILSKTLAGCLLESALHRKLALVSLVVFVKFVSGILIVFMITEKFMVMKNSTLSV